MRDEGRYYVFLHHASTNNIVNWCRDVRKQEQAKGLRKMCWAKRDGKPVFLNECFDSEEGLGRKKEVKTKTGVTSTKSLVFWDFCEQQKLKGMRKERRAAHAH